jgi:hypothetical protein
VVGSALVADSTSGGSRGGSGDTSVPSRFVQTGLGAGVGVSRVTLGTFRCTVLVSGPDVPFH